MTTSARACLGATCAALLLAGCSSPQASSAGWNPYAAYERPIQADPPEETEQPPEVEEVSPASLRLVVFVDSGELEAIKAALQAAIDRSGTPERPAAGSVKELELAGDPALQTYTRWTGGRHHGKEPILIAGYEVSFRAKLGDGLDPMRAVWIGKDKQTFDLGSRKSAAQLIELGLGRYRLTFDFEKPTPVKR